MGDVEMELIEHIGIFDNAIPAELCKETIDYFNSEAALNLIWKREEKTNIREDLNISARELIRTQALGMDAPTFVSETMQRFWDCYRLYTDKYQTLNSASRHFVAQVKWQKTAPTEGYHIWHAENLARTHANRLITFIIYLNDVHEGGETEFLYQSLRVKPETGKLVIWPATYTHTHRGNPPLKETKYIMTGWLEFGEI